MPEKDKDIIDLANRYILEEDNKPILASDFVKKFNLKQEAWVNFKYRMIFCGLLAARNAGSREIYYSIKTE